MKVSRKCTEKPYLSNYYKSFLAINYFYNQGLVSLKCIYNQTIYIRPNRIISARPIKGQKKQPKLVIDVHSPQFVNPWTGFV